ncbi:hypothetical protein SK128_006041 [Halocaridina rubra]|uniref:Uncharacterized protein n=1 Tax=Halocaridina rubra TaxID=373956 RepID=A0AAN8WEG9_HALRR
MKLDFLQGNRDFHNAKPHRGNDQTHVSRIREGSLLERMQQPKNHELQLIKQNFLQKHGDNNNTRDYRNYYQSIDSRFLEGIPSKSMQQMRKIVPKRKSEVGLSSTSPTSPKVTKYLSFKRKNDIATSKKRRTLKRKWPIESKTLIYRERTIRRGIIRRLLTPPHFIDFHDKPGNSEMICLSSQPKRKKE